MIKIIKLLEGILKLTKASAFTYKDYLVRTSLILGGIVSVLLLFSLIAVSYSYGIVAMVLLFSMMGVVVCWMIILSPVAMTFFKINENVETFRKWMSVIQGVIMAILLFSIMVVLLPVENNMEATAVLFVVMISLGVIFGLRR